MALFQPTNVIPSTLSGVGDGTVDATEALTVSWQVNGSSPLVAYRICIMANDADSTLKYDSTKVTLAAPFWGTNQWGVPQLFNAVIPAADLASSGIVNGYADGYKLKITQWWNANDYVEQTSASYFITRTRPQLIMQSIPYSDSFRYAEYTFEAYYIQAQGDTVEWSRWELQAYADGKYIDVDDTGTMYRTPMIQHIGYSGLQYTYNGFVIGINGRDDTTGVKYRLKCTVQTENGVVADTGWAEITTQDIGTYNASLKLCASKENDAVMVQFGKNFMRPGISTGGYSFVTRPNGNTKCLSLESRARVLWGSAEEPLIGIDGTHTITVKFVITDTSEYNTFFTVAYEDFQLKLSYNYNGFYIKIMEHEVWHTHIAPIVNAQVTISVTNGNVFFGQNDNGNIQALTGVIQNWQTSKMNQIRIHGPATFYYITVENEQYDYEDFYYQMATWDYSPQYLDTTVFLCGFNGTLYSTSDLVDDTIKSFGIYRKGDNTPLFRHIATIPLNDNAYDTVVYDYSALSTKSYEYYFLNMRNDSYVRTRNAVTTIRPCFWNYTVLCCSKNNSGDYIVESEYRFALNVESGNVSNNNAPTMQKNFTPYPLRQPTSVNYRSGTLAALIGKVENDRYVDSTALMDELYALSTNNLTKFLKTRKGQIFQIETLNPVIMQIVDKYAEQPAKISLPWVEVGDASDVNILGDSLTSSGVPTFDVNVSDMELVMTYDPASLMGANSFTLSDANLYLNESGTLSEDSFSINKNNEVILSE